MSSDEPSETREEIMHATYRALARHGYADLSITAIGEEFEKSPSLVYYHYDSKDDLLLSFLDFVLDEFTALFEDGRDDDPESRLRDLIDAALPVEPDDEEREFYRVFTELRARSVRHPAYREKFRELESRTVDTAATLIESGVEEGRFAVDDADRAAEHIVALLLYGLTVRTTSGRDPGVEEARRRAEELFVELGDEAPDGEPG
jgi:AcrR family transcriptional regulator